MFEEITFMKVLGMPLIVYGGAFTSTLFFLTALIPALNKKGIIKVSSKWHPRMAYLSLASAFIHGLLGILAYL